MSLLGFFNFIIYFIMRFIRYSRKSSEGNESQVQSIPDQNAVLERLAGDQGLTVAFKLEESRSAKKPGIRPVFAEMIKLLEMGKADGILCWHLNRLTRNPVDAGTLSWLLQQGIIKCIKTPHREYRPEDNVLIMAVENADSNQYILDLRNNLRRAQVEKAGRGWYPRKPPGGYFTNRDTGEIEADPERFPLLRRAWELMLTGAYSVPEVHQLLQGWGYRTRLIHRKSLTPRPGKMMTESNLYQLFDNRFYLGEFNFEGEVHRGKHQPMVTREEFARVQEILHGVAPMASMRHFFAYTGLIRCGGCGCLVTAECKVKHYPRTNRTVSYTYYHCTRSKACTQPAVTVGYVEGVVSAKLARCKLNPEALEWAREAILSHEETFDSLPELLKQDEASLKTVRSKLEGLYELRLSGEITADELKTLKTKYQPEADHLERNVERMTHLTERNRQTVDNLLSYVATADALFQHGDDKVKRQIARLLADHYLLTLGELVIQPHPLLEPLIALEPPEGPRDKVRDGPLGPQIPFLCAWVEHIRTLLRTQDVSFGELECLQQVRELGLEKLIVAQTEQAIDPESRAA